MTKFDDTNRGQIWKNEKKREGKSDPDFTGSQNCVCAKCGEASEYWVSAWKRKEGAADRAPALTFSVKPKDGKPREETKQAAPVKQAAHFDDEIPFMAEFR